MSTRVYQREVTAVTVVINAHDCPTCGVIYGLAVDYEERRRKDGESWKCPNGHWVSYHKTAADEAKEEAEQLRQQLESQRGWSNKLESDLAAERKQHASTKGQLTVTRKRVQSGVCPVDGCRRHFTNLERHMATKHPVEPGT